MSFGVFGSFGNGPKPTPVGTTFGVGAAAAGGAAAPSPFGSFGSSTANQNQQNQQQQPAQSGTGFGGGAFGASTSTQTQGGTGAFGAPPAPSINVSNPTGTSTTNLFPGGTSSFGSTLAPPAQTGPSNPFGAGSSSTPAPGASTSFGTGFGGQNQPSSAGASTFKPFGASTTGAFGAAPAAGGSNPAPSAFGASTLGQSTLGVSSLGQSSATATPPVATGIEGQIQAIEAAITPGSASNRFQYYFYNLVDADQVHLFGRPPNATNEALWQRANRENPNPSRLVPALAVGFDDLKKRADAQKAQVDGQLAAIQMLKREVDKLSTNHALKILPQAQKLAHAHAQLSARLAALIHHLHLFIPSLRGASLRPEEEALRTRLDALDGELTGRADALGRAGGRMAELWGVVGRVKAKKEAGMLYGTGESAGWAVVDPAAFEELKTILVNEQQGLKFLTDTLRTALRDIDTVRSDFAHLDLSSPS